MDIEEAKLPWSQAVVMVCTKCSKKIIGDESLADSFKKELKSEFKEKRGKGFRVVTSSCLDVCPKNRMALAVAVKNGETRAIEFDSKVKPGLLIAEILKTPGL